MFNLVFCIQYMRNRADLCLFTYFSTGQSAQTSIVFRFPPQLVGGNGKQGE